MKFKREDGVRDSIRRRDGTEMRYHISKRNGTIVVTRVPWHFDKIGDHGWYQGVLGPEMDLESLKFLINEFEMGRNG